MKTVKIILAASILFFNFLPANAQLKSSPYEIGINFGTAFYAGDLTPTFFSPYKSPSYIFGIIGSKNLSNVFAMQAKLGLGKIKADDANYKNPPFRQQRNFSFKTSITELTANLIFTPLGKDKLLTPYFLAGAGLSFLKVRRDYSNLNAEYFGDNPAITQGLPDDIAHLLPRIIAVLPVGLGIRYALNKKISLNLLTSYRLMSNDYLDGFSKAADPSKNDHYYTHSIGLNYSFGEKNRLDCPTK